MAKKIRLGVVGLGRGLVAKSLIRRSDVVLAAICDRRQDRLNAAEKEIAEELKKRKRRYKPAAFLDFDEMLESDIDAVYIATDANYHVPLVKKAMDAGKHVISEIPAIDTLEEARELKACVAAHPKLKYMIAENCNYWAFIETWKRMYEDGMLGKAVYAEGAYLHALDWRGRSPDKIDRNHWR